MNVLVIDVGGTHVKILATGQTDHREFVSGPTLTARAMATRVKKLAGNWKYEAVSIGYPGPVLNGRPVIEPHNLGAGWVGFNYERTFRRPVKVVNDAAMQALGSYKGGKMLFLGLGTGLGSTLIVEGIIEPMELGHLPYKKATYEDYIGLRGLQRHGKKKWRKLVADVVERLIAALEPDDVVLGGGNVKKLKKLPPHCRVGENANAFAGGFRLWESAPKRRPARRAKPRPARKAKAPAARRAKTRPPRPVQARPTPKARVRPIRRRPRAQVETPPAPEPVSPPASQIVEENPTPITPATPVIPA